MTKLIWERNNRRIFWPPAGERPITMVDTMVLNNLVRKDNDLKPMAAKLLEELQATTCCCAITGQDCLGPGCTNPCRVCD